MPAVSMLPKAFITGVAETVDPDVVRVAAWHETSTYAAETLFRCADGTWLTVGTDSERSDANRPAVNKWLHAVTGGSLLMTEQGSSFDTDGTPALWTSWALA